MKRGCNPSVIRIDVDSDTPVARQVADAIRALLVAGAFLPGAQMPTVRRIAIDLGVNHNTIASAYRALAAEGWLELNRRRGAIVMDRARPRPNSEARGRFTRRLRELVAEVYSAGVPLAQIKSELQVGASDLKPRGPKG